MTLMEVLVAVIVLAVGMSGVLALFPIAVDSVGTMSKRTHADTIARNAITSLKAGRLRMWGIQDDNDVETTYGLTAPLGDWCVRNATGIAAVKVGEFVDWPQAIALAGGYSRTRGFKIPEDLVPYADFFNYDGGVPVSVSPVTVKTWTWTDFKTYQVNQAVRPTKPNGYCYVATTAGNSGGVEPTWPEKDGATLTDDGVQWVCRWNYPPGYGWTATFLPDFDSITRNSNYDVQIAVWRKFVAKDCSIMSGASGDTVTLSVDFSSWLLPGDYIRSKDKVGVWYRIASVNGKTIKTVGNHGFDSAVDTAQCASHLWLTKLYQTRIYPRSGQ